MMQAYTFGQYSWAVLCRVSEYICSCHVVLTNISSADV